MVILKSCSTSRENFLFLGSHEKLYSHEKQERGEILLMVNILGLSKRPALLNFFVHVTNLSLLN